MAEIILVLAGLDRLPGLGSFSLTSGVLDRDQIRRGAGGFDGEWGFVAGDAIEMRRALWVNAVDPELPEVSAPRYGEWFPDYDPVPSERVPRTL